MICYATKYKAIASSLHKLSSFFPRIFLSKIPKALTRLAL